MKHTLLLFATALIFGIQTYAQNVGINDDGSTPDNSAILHVKSVNKGLLIPQIALTGVNDATTITSPTTSLLVFNTTDGSGLTPGYYYNSGTPVIPVWKALTAIGGLTNFTESNYLYNTKYGVKLLARNDAQTDVDFVLSPKGNGGILAQQPDGSSGSTAGGNERGQHAVDLQTSRIFNNMVASGNNSVIVGGYSNKASGYGSTAMGVLSYALGDYSTAMGHSTHATGNYSTTMGDGTIAPSAFEIAIGRYNEQYTPVNTSDWDYNDKLFVIGNGASSIGRSNALTIMKNANTTIGGSLTINGNGTGTSLALPATRGTSGQVLQTDGSGGTNWSAPAGGTVTGVTGTAPIASSGGTAPVISISAATTSAAGSMSAADKTKLDAITGTNTGNQTITLTGDVTGTGTGSFTTTIAASAVTNSKMANMAANTIKVNSTASAAAPTDISIAINTFPSRKSTGNITANAITDFAFTLLDDADAATVRTTLGAGTGNGSVTGVTGTAPIASSGGADPVISISAATTSSAGSMSATDKTKLDGLVSSQWTTTSSDIYYNAGKVGIGTTDPNAELELGNTIANRKIALWTTNNNDHQFYGFGVNTSVLRYQVGKVAANHVFYAGTSETTSNELFKIQGDGQIVIPALTTSGVILNNSSGLISSSVGISGQVLSTNVSGGISWTTPSSGTVTNVSGTSPISVATGNSTPLISISAATTSLPGSMSAADKTKLDAITGTNTGDQTIILTGDVVGSGTGSFPAAISASSVTNPKMANMAANTIKVNNAGSAAAPTDLSIPANSFPSRRSAGNMNANVITDFAFDILHDADAAAVRTTIGAGTGNGTVTTVTGTAPISVATGTTTPAISISPATTNAAGSMSAADKTKLDGSTHAIGDSYGGGIVFYVYDGGRHGLIAATSDQSPGGIRWYGGSNTNTRARADGIGAGLKNTAIIIANQGPVDGNAFAATVCNEYSVTADGVTYGDWYLPSIYELNLLYIQKDAVGGFSGVVYWSSTENTDNTAWFWHFGTGGHLFTGKSNTYNVRAIRSF